MEVLNKKKKVFVGLSGGVDSSVSAALLKDEGYDVTGVFIKVWHPDFLPCDWKEERRDAMRVCVKLDIPFLTFDFEKEYKQHVVDYMIAEYKAGRTPNPDVMCNKNIKFGSFVKKALEMGADYIATGHYAQIEEKMLDGKKVFALLESKDKAKDQSYFLWTLNSEQLAHTLFPVGNFEKKDVRKLAEKYGLHTAVKKDSQGLCFMGQVDMKDFLKHFLNEKSGDVVNESGERIGTHDGALFYTIGQRHGFEITKKTPTDEPYYVVSKDIEKNTLAVSYKTAESAQVGVSKKVILKDLNWISKIPEEKIKITARIRYHQQPQTCQITSVTGTQSTSQIEVMFDEPQDAALGQSVVFYDNEDCRGGGVIHSL